jgi:hypothetical protein
VKKKKRRAERCVATLFIGDVTSRGDWRVPTGESSPLGITRNWSETGVFIETHARPAVDSIIEISVVWGDDAVRTRARVIRHTEGGIGLDFVDPPAPFAYVVREILRESD